MQTVKRLSASPLFIGLFSMLVFAASAWAGSEKVLYQFKSPRDGQFLLNGVLLLNGRIYGVTYQGGSARSGTVSVSQDRSEPYLVGTVSQPGAYAELVSVLARPSGRAFSFLNSPRIAFLADIAKFGGEFLGSR